MALSRRTFLIACATAWSCRDRREGGPSGGGEGGHPGGRGGGPSGPAEARSRPSPAEDPVTEIEWHVLFLTNQQRNFRKLPPLEASPALASVARAHSRDMLERGFFAHRTPEGLDPRGRVHKNGLTFVRVAENIYSSRNGSSDPAEAASIMVTAWMAHEGHRRNILDPLLKELGVGVALSDRMVLATQLFGG